MLVKSSYTHTTKTPVCVIFYYVIIMCNGEFICKATQQPIKAAQSQLCLIHLLGIAVFKMHLSSITLHLINLFAVCVVRYVYVHVYM